MRIILWVASLLFFAAPLAAQQINPANQIAWPRITAAGAPTLTCNSQNFGQPYTDTSANKNYTCGSTGWFPANTLDQCSTVVTDSTHICITHSPFNAYGATTTTLTATMAPGTTGTVASCAPFIPTEGVVIAGAGAAGADYLGTVVSCNANTLTVTPATSTSVLAQTIVVPGLNAKTTGTFGVGTSGPVSSCVTFVPNQGVLIGGAGAAGANYVGTVVTCTGTTLTVSPATSTSVGTGVAVNHDESAAFQSAITAGANAGIMIYVPDGFYYLNGPLKDTSHANAMLLLSNLNYGASASQAPVIDIRGFTHPSTLTTAGAILFSSIPSGNVIAGYNPSSPAQFVGFTNYWVDVEDITFRGPHNPGFVWLNLKNAVAARVEHMRCDTGVSGDSPVPTNTNSGCLYFPSFGNNTALASRDLIVAGYANAVWAFEHADIDDLLEANDINGLIADTGPLGVPTDGHNTIHVGYWWCQVCTNQLAAGVSPASVQIDMMDIETATAHGINDPSNFLNGTLNYLIQGGAGAVTPTDPALNGAANLCINNLSHPGYSQNCLQTTGQGVPTVTVGTAAGAGATVTVISGSNDKSGVIQLVTGSSGLTTNGQLVIVTLQNGRRTPPMPVLTPANVTTPGAAVWVSATGNTVWDINSGSVALTANTTYKWVYTSGGFN